MSGLWEEFTCQRCGRCCEKIGLPYDPSRVSMMAEFLKIPEEELITRYYGLLLPEGTSWISDDRKRTPCPFLEREGAGSRCAIYPVRPEGCRAFPVETRLGTGGVDCPGAALLSWRLRERGRLTPKEEAWLSRL